ncbi:hypothetical protein E4K72_03520 [Oxalobacteraceae bacterium OM1]|nr:hypothetical protein E4K72_03520 [Oxalobacteraceae bacterium OM1]
MYMKLFDRLSAPLATTSLALLALSATCLISGCAVTARGPLNETPKTTQLPALEKPAAIGEDEGIDDEYLGVNGKPLLVSTALSTSDPLPNLAVKRVSFSNVALYDVIRTVTDGMDLAMTVSSDHPDAQILRRHVTARWLSGPLPEILDDLSQKYGFFWSYRNGTLHVEADRQFITNIPPVNELFESLPTMLKTLGAQDVFLDKTNRTITFRAGRAVYDRIAQYLKYVRENKSLIVYDTYIWEVRLNDESQLGVNWRSLPVGPLSDAGGSGAKVANATTALSLSEATGLTNGVGVGMTFAGSRFSMNVLLNFLRAQGTLNALSQPKVQVLSGGKAFVKRDISTGYVSRISPSTAANGLILPGAVETAQISTGIFVTLSGDVSDGTVYTDINVKVSDLLAMQPVDAAGTVIGLPKTATSEVNTLVRSRPNDVILLAGIQIQRTSEDGFGLPSGTGKIGLPTRLSRQAERSELVIVLRPRIKRFVQKGEDK